MGRLEEESLRITEKILDALKNDLPPKTDLKHLRRNAPAWIANILTVNGVADEVRATQESKNAEIIAAKVRAGCEAAEAASYEMAQAKARTEEKLQAREAWQEQDTALADAVRLVFREFAGVLLDEKKEREEG